METLADFPSAATIVGGLLALVVAGIVVARLLRSRASRTPPVTTGPPPVPDPAYLDSSHIISGAPLGSAERAAQADGGTVAPGDGAAKPGAPDADSHRGPRP